MPLNKKAIVRYQVIDDKAVMEAYGFNWRTMTESDCVAELFKLYQKFTK